MAACSLKIELDDPQKTRTGGETITGTVIVTTTGQVQCKALEVTSTWSTHGRGNIDTGAVDQQVLFQGQWEPSREYRYTFTLKTATWPPTYYGTLLNVSHDVRVCAKIPWSKDPTASVEYTVLATAPPEDLKPPETIKKPQSLIGWALGWVFGSILVVVLLVMLGGLLAILAIPLLIGAGCYWFVRVFLPRQLTGSIDCTVDPKRVVAGQAIRGQLRFTPKRNININSILWTVTCGEKCSSGSGSDRKTYTHEILNQTQRLSEAGQLRAGELQSFEFSFPVPPDAPPSLKFSNNELTWEGVLRIDIPKWPDWVQKFPLVVTPSPEHPIAGPKTYSDELPASPEEEWFYEVLRQVERCQNDPANLQTVLDAVRDQPFAVRADIDEELDQPPPSAPGETGTWRIASLMRSNIELALVWPASMGAPAVGTENWRGQAKILGFDASIDCLVMRVV